MNKQEFVQCPRCLGTGKVKNNAYAKWELIGIQAKSRREKLGLTQENVAERLGVTRTTVTNFEVGKQRPGLDMLARYAEILEMNLIDFIKDFDSVS